ncbi:MAG: pentapeptide repeat-containing protein [Candidatus Portnoybacteria bacterium]|nr:pentapeptide repeat-containing protein [Candidatus Portnoybacteria bacterium]
MSEFEEMGGKPPGQEAETPKKLTREEIEERLARGEDMENLILTDLDLAGLNFEGKSFRGSDIRGMILYREERKEDGTIFEVRTNVKNTDWRDATIADLGVEVFFRRVDAEGAIFAYTEDLTSRRQRHGISDEPPMPEDTGGLFNFNGREGNFKRTKWISVDFGGGSGYEAIFTGADLSESIIESSDLAQMDFSTANIEGIKIKGQLSLQGMKINEHQVSSLVRGIELTDETERLEFLELVKGRGEAEALKEYFGIIIVEATK